MFIIHKFKKMIRFVKFKVITNLENRTLKNLMVNELQTESYKRDMGNSLIKCKMFQCFETTATYREI